MVIIFRGISGSGKSTFANFLVNKKASELDRHVNNTSAREFIWHLYGTAPERRIIFSADSYFMKDGKYLFDPSKLSAAHGQCLQEFTELIYSEPVTSIVDNTNCSVAEVAPYAALAIAYSHDLHVVTLIGDPVICWNRGQHRVPFSNVLRQDMNLRKSLLDWPSWYPQQIFPV